MCIRDSPKSLGTRTRCPLELIGMNSVRPWIMPRNAACRASICLLYTSGRCRRIERCPSRGLGDVYKRQPEELGHQDQVPARAYRYELGQALDYAQERSLQGEYLSLIHIWTLPTNREVSVSWARRCV